MRIFSSKAASQTPLREPEQNNNPIHLCLQRGTEKQEKEKNRRKQERLRTCILRVLKTNQKKPSRSGGGGELKYARRCLKKQRLWMFKQRPLSLGGRLTATKISAVGPSESPKESPHPHQFVAPIFLKVCPRKRGEWGDARVGSSTEGRVLKVGGLEDLRRQARP